MKATLEDVGANGYEGASAESRARYVEAFDEGVGRLERLMVEAAAGESRWRDKLRAGLRALLAELDREPLVGRAIVVEVHAAGPEALARRALAIRRAVAFVDQAQRDVDGAVPRPRIASEGVVAGLHSILHARLSTGNEGSFAALLPEFMYFAVLPYFGHEAAQEAMAAERG